MPAAPIPADEAARLSALRAYEILDAATEQAYDDVVRLAATICGTEMAAVTFVDEARQWLLADVGFGTRETARDTAFCAHTILDASPLVVPDARDDARFADNPFVLGAPRIRFYAGAPLITPGGQRLGSVCVFDDAPRELTPPQVEALEALARLVVRQLEQRRTAKQLAEALGQVRTLSGLLPICAYCKRVRDDADYWHSVEEYVGERTDARFSHGICPSCSAIHFPVDR